MKKVIFLFTCLILSVTVVSFADNSQVVTLKDGSQIKGELSGISNGVYTVKTPIIGDVHVAAGDVASITNANVSVSAPAGPPPTNTNSPSPTPLNQPVDGVPNLDQQIAASQKQLLSNPRSMETLQEMMQDPEIMEALSDPALVQAVTSHDYQAIENNPSVQKLMNNPKMRAFIEKLEAEQHHHLNPTQQQ